MIKFGKQKKAIAGVLAFTLLMGLATGCGKKTEATETGEIPSADYIGETTENTLTFYSDGSVMEIACEDYSEVNFDYSDLQDYITSEIEQYNQEAGVSKVSLLEYQDQDGMVKTATKYTDFDTYTGFNNMDMILSLYDAEQADEIAKEEAEKQQEIASDMNETASDSSEVSADELAEAGYSIDQIQTADDGSAASELSSALGAENTVASFTDTDTGETVTSGSVPADGNMMLVISDKVDVRLENGKILYTNSHATVTDNVASTDGTGKAIIVFYLTY